MLLNAHTYSSLIISYFLAFLLLNIISFSILQRIYNFFFKLKKLKFYKWSKTNLILYIIITLLFIIRMIDFILILTINYLKLVHFNF
jgi:hypothetical protein